MQDSQDKDTSTDGVQTEYKRINKKSRKGGVGFRSRSDRPWVSGLFLEGKAAGACCNHPLPYRTEVKERVELILITRLKIYS